MRLVQDAKKIRLARQAMVRAIKSGETRKVDTVLGFQGESFPAKVLWSELLGIWLYPGLIKGSRYWNAFGTGPMKKGSVDITCEVNFPLSGIDRRIAGAVVEDEANNLYIAHRGRIGGGKAGVGTQLFWDNFDGGSPTIVVDGDRETRMAMIGPLNSPKLGIHLRFFVQEVQRIKGQATADGHPDKIFRLQDFRNEFEGIKTIRITEIYQAACDHGIVVNRLRQCLKDIGCATGKDKFRDLYVHRNGKVTSLFEVKPDCSTTSLYTAIGQLFFHSLGLPSNPDRVIVLPANTPEKLIGKLKQLQLKVLLFDWNEGEPLFRNLAQTKF